MPHYAAMVESMDENVGRVLKTLKNKGVAQNTIVVFTSDNGGMATSSRTGNIPTTNLQLKAGKGYLYEGGIRVPLIIRWPGEIEAGSTSDFPVTGTDYYPTLLDLAGIGKKPGQYQDGISLKPVLKGRDMNERPIYWHYPHYSGGLGGTPSAAIRLGNYKLIEFYEDDHLELYNLEKDIGENQDISGKKLKIATKLKKMLKDWRTEVNAQMPYLNPAYDEDQEE
jgi:arylsulfatase A-like enzyme